MIWYEDVKWMVKNGMSLNWNVTNRHRLRQSEKYADDDLWINKEAMKNIDEKIDMFE